MEKTLDLLIQLHLFGDYYAWSPVNDVKRLQTGYTKKIPLFNDGFAEILLLTRPKFLKMS